MSLPVSVESLVQHRVLGLCLEAPFYTSREVYEADLDLIFRRHWIFVASEPDVPEPGDCMTAEVAGASILLLRGEDMEIRAFHNVCRHRGARLIQESKTTVGNIVCRYHQWTYGETGDLLFAEHMGPEFDTSCHGLKQIHLRRVAGLVFICLADEPPTDIDRMEAELTPYLAPHDLANCKVAHSSDLIEHGNWKLTIENNRECYHCVSNHPELTIPLQEYGFGFSPHEMDDFRKADVERYEKQLVESYARWATLGLPSEELDQLTTTVTAFRAQRLALKGAGESHTLDACVASRKLLGALTESRLGGLSVWTHPNSWHHFMSDHIVTFSVLPVSPNETLLRTTWLVHKDAVEGVDYDLHNLTRVWLMTNQQDADLVALAQEGVEQPGYEPGPYSPFTEGFVEKFCQWYIDRMAAHLWAEPAAVAAE